MCNVRTFVIHKYVIIFVRTYGTYENVIWPNPRAGSGVTLTFACYRGSAATLQTQNITNTFWHTQKKYLPINFIHQDFSATKNINNAEHTEMPLNC